MNIDNVPNSKYKGLLLYLLFFAGSVLLIIWLLNSGRELEKGLAIIGKTATNSSWQLFTQSVNHSFSSPLSQLLFQLITIVITARLFGWLCKKIGQPAVIGEIIAGIALGPSLLGSFAPGIFHVLFPIASLGALGLLSQLGLILFMFVVGMELDNGRLASKAKVAVIISHVSIVFPFLLGIVLAYFIYLPTAPKGIGFIAYALFIGVSMSITAFPVLARIVQEKGFAGTRLGNLAITCAAADDVTAWCILAAVIAIVKSGSISSSVFTIALAGIYILLMFKVLRPLLNRLARKDTANKSLIALCLLTLILSAWCTELIGIHALFGAFIAGTVMPANSVFRKLMTGKVEDLALTLLLPLFFVFTGLRTQIGLLSTARDWLFCAAFIAVAVIGKFIGSAGAAKLMGESVKNSLMIGALMNTRGLMELVALNIGYELGVLSPSVFTMLVIMALATTIMTGPALSLIKRIR